MKTFKILLVLILAVVYSQAHAQLTYRAAFPNLTFANPIEMVSSYDGTNRLFVAEQRGKIYVFPNDRNVTTAQKKLFLDLSSIVSPSGSETGLLGLAFHPDYENNGYFYVDYTMTVGSTYRDVVARYKVSASDPDVADPSSAQILLNIWDPYSNHNGGKLAFGPNDGYLYISTGDGGSGGDPGNRAQNRDSLLGKILRIDVNTTSGGNNYGIPPTNPYAGSTNTWRKEIYAYGMRNTWRYSFDSLTNRLWAGDVGQDAWEEIDTISNGGNYGWKVMEATHCYSPSSGCDQTGKILPIFEYSHSVGISITGGFVCRSPRAPQIAGKYIYADYSNGKIWALTYEGLTTPTNQQLFDTPHLISAFATDDRGSLYYTQLSSTGQIYEILDTTVTGVSGGTVITPANFDMAQNFPNPFNPTTVIEFSVPATEKVTLAVYDISGKLVANLIDGETLSPGVYQKNFSAGNLASGIYFYTIKAGSFSMTKKMTLLK